MTCMAKVSGDDDIQAQSVPCYIWGIILARLLVSLGSLFL